MSIKMTIKRILAIYLPLFLLINHAVLDAQEPAASEQSAETQNVSPEEQKTDSKAPEANSSTAKSSSQPPGNTITATFEDKVFASTEKLQVDPTSGTAALS